MSQFVNRTRLILLGAIVAMLSSCAQEFKVRAEYDDGRIRLHFVKGIIFEKQHNVCVSRIDIIERPSATIVWAIRALPGKCKNTSTFYIGAVPPGYGETTSKLPLNSEKYYEAGVLGENGEVGISSPWQFKR